MTHLTLDVDGMSCGHCISAVNRTLEGIPGLITRSVTLGTVEVDLEAGGATPEIVIAALADAGYPATVTTSG
jgi:copper chaperone CopZ